MWQLKVTKTKQREEEKKNRFLFILANQLQSKKGKTVTSNQPSSPEAQNGPLRPQKSPLRPQNESAGPKKGPVRTQKEPLGPQKGPVRAQIESTGPKKAPLRAQNEPVDPQKGPIAPPKRNSKLLSTTGQTSSVNQEKINGDSSSISPPTRKTFKKIKKQPTSASSGDGKVISST